jgi:hypothetical protein
MIPSYKRPEMLKTCIDSAIATASDLKRLCFAIMLHTGDTSYDNFHFPTETILLFEQETEPNLSLFYNRMYSETCYDRQEHLVSMVGDDMAFQTKNWDMKILDKANEIDGVGIIHCEDAFISHGSIPVNLFTSRKFVDAAGPTFMCPYYKADYIDTVWGEIATTVDCNYFLSDVIIKHNHTTGKPQWDETFQRLQRVKKHSQKEYWEYVNRCVKNLYESGLI